MQNSLFAKFNRAVRRNAIYGGLPKFLQHMTVRLRRPQSLRLAYVADYRAGDSTGFSVDTTTGALVMFPGSPFPSASELIDVAADPLSRTRAASPWYAQYCLDIHCGWNILHTSASRDRQFHFSSARINLIPLRTTGQRIITGQGLTNSILTEWGHRRAIADVALCRFRSGSTHPASRLTKSPGDKERP